MGLMTSPCGRLLSSMQCGYITVCPNQKSRLTPMEFITKQKADHSDLLRSRVWGCPAYVEALFANFEFCANWLEAGHTPAAAIPRGDGAVTSDSEDDSSVASGSSESEGGFGGANADDNGPKVRQVQSNLDSEGAISCAIPKCQSCDLTRAQQRSPKVRQVLLNLDSEGAISCAIPKCQSCELARA